MEYKAHRNEGAGVRCCKERTWGSPLSSSQVGSSPGGSVPQGLDVCHIPELFFPRTEQGNSVSNLPKGFGGDEAGNKTQLSFSK